MAAGSEVSEHYTRGDLKARLDAALRDDGVEPERPSIADLAPYDQFHGRGLEATEELAALLDMAPSDHLLDVGSGIGGPARYLAERFGCRITGIDLTPDFCALARHLTGQLGLDGRVAFEQGNALAMPFQDASFDGAYSMNVSMNIADKAAFYGEIRRVLKPGAWLVLSELAQGPGGPPDYPTPWAGSPENSFLATPEETRRGLEAAGFTVVRSRDLVAETLAFGARAKAQVECGEKPPHRAIQLIHGKTEAPVMMANTSGGVREGRLVPIEVFCTKDQ